MLGFGLSACGKDPPRETGATKAGAPAETPASGSTPDREAEIIFKARCIVCHGATGKGDGPGAAALKVKPRNYTDPDWQSTVTDEELKAIILSGGSAVGKDAAMPPNADLKKKPEVVDGLVRMIRALAAKQ